MTSMTPSPNPTPKISYRSTTTCSTYHMLMQINGFRITQVSWDGILLDESPLYPYVAPWRGVIDKFFDKIDAHINGRQWEE